MGIRGDTEKASLAVSEAEQEEDEVHLISFPLLPPSINICVYTHMYICIYDVFFF